MRISILWITVIFIVAILASETLAKKSGKESEKLQGRYDKKRQGTNFRTQEINKKYPIDEISKIQNSKYKRSASQESDDSLTSAAENKAPSKPTHKRQKQEENVGVKNHKSVENQREVKHDAATDKFKNGQGKKQKHSRKHSVEPKEYTNASNGGRRTKKVINEWENKKSKGVKVESGSAKHEKVQVIKKKTKHGKNDRSPLVENSDNKKDTVDNKAHKSKHDKKKKQETPIAEKVKAENVKKDSTKDSIHDEIHKKKHTQTHHKTLKRHDEKNREKREISDPRESSPVQSSNEAEKQEKNQEISAGDEIIADENIKIEDEVSNVYYHREDSISDFADNGDENY